MGHSIIRRVKCPWCKRGGRRLTQLNRMWRHKPFTAAFAPGMIEDCKGSGRRLDEYRAEESE